MDLMLAIVIGIVVFLAVLLPVIASYTSFESRVRDALAKRDLNSKQGVMVHYRIEVSRSSRGGQTKTLYVDYAVSIGGGPAGNLHIIREGVTSAGLEAVGEREVVTDDKDFNDYFWVYSSSEGFLTPARQKLLVHGFEDLPAGVYIRNGSIRGSINTSFVFGVGAIVNEITKAVALANWLQDPDTYAKHLPKRRPGWVGRRKRLHTCFGFWASSLSLLVLLGALCLPLSQLKLDSGMAAAILTMALALLYFITGLLYLTANKLARRLADVSLSVTLLCLLLAAVEIGRQLSLENLFYSFWIPIVLAYLLRYLWLLLKRVPLQ